MHFPKTFAALALVASVLAHPNHDINEELRAREEAMLTLPRDLSHCAEKLAVRGITAEAAKRRAQIAREAREKRGLDVDAPYLQGRDFNTVLNTSHKSHVNYNPSTPESILFAGNKSCILSPETTEGPYYVAGEFVRSDIRDGQKGVDLILDTQVIDIATCEPVDYALVEIWHCNSTGVYGGVVAQGNGVGSQDSSNLYNTMLRGLQHTDRQGVSQFNTIFPGWYTGRAVHIHVLVHLNSQVLADGHYAGGTNAHVGQLFFDQTLIDEVGKVSPYSTNKQTLMQNKADSIFSQEAVTGDPVINYSLLGNSIDKGLFGWVAFGIDTKASVNVRPAVSLAATVTPKNAGPATGVPKA